MIGSTVTAAELTAALVPTGKQYIYQITSNLGTFSPGATAFTNEYIQLQASGYYFDEVANALSTGPLVLNGLSLLRSDSVLNVNLLTTLAYQRTQKLVTNQGMSFLAARAQAEAEVLAALEIRDGNQYGSFATYDLSKSQDGDHILAAISSLFVNGNTAGQLSVLMATVGADIASNGTITSATTKATLATSAQQIDPVAVAANLTAEYESLGLSFAPTDISDWLDQDGDGLVGKFKFTAIQAPGGTAHVFPAYIVPATDNGAVYTLVGTGTFTDNGGATTTSATVATGDSIVVTRTPAAHDASNAYVEIGSTKVARFGFTPWTADGSLVNARATFTATALPNGKVLMAGGLISGGPSALAELFDPATGQSATLPNMSNPHSEHAAVLLNNGKVLVIGGFSAQYPPSVSPELFDPSTNSWSLTASSGSPNGADFPAILLPDGRVLVVGPGAASGSVQGNTTIYDPSTNTWSVAASMNVSPGRSYHTATLLASGKVLVVGGTSGNSVVDDVEIYDPASNTWTAAAAYPTSIFSHTATMLSNGKVLVAGGSAANVGNTPLAAPAELFDPVSNTWSPAGTLATPRYFHQAQLLPDGTVFVAGGITLASSIYATVASAERYDPTTNQWGPAGSLATPRYNFGLAMLSTGRVIIAGGSTLASPQLIGSVETVQ